MYFIHIFGVIMKKQFFHKIFSILLIGVLASGLALSQNFNINGGSFIYTSLQDAIDYASAGDIIGWDGTGSPYQPANPVRVNKQVTINGLNGTNKLHIKGATNSSTWSGAKSAFLISASGSGATIIKNFIISDAYDLQCQVQNSGIWIGYDFNPTTSSGTMENGVNNVTIENCEIYDCSHGITMNNCQDINILNNEIHNMVGTDNTTSGGKGIVIWEDDTVYVLSNILIDGNKIYNNQYFGIVIDVTENFEAEDYSSFGSGLIITNNEIYDNRGSFDNFKYCVGPNTGNYPNGYGNGSNGYYGGIGIISYGYTTNVFIEKNKIYGHTTHTSDCGEIFERASGIWSARDKDWVIKNNDIYNNFTGIYFKSASGLTGQNTGHQVTFNYIHDNTRGMAIDNEIANGYTMYNFFKDNNANNSFYSSCSPSYPAYGILNKDVGGSNNLHMAHYNWWGDCSGPSSDGSSCYASPDPGTPSGSGDKVSCYVDYNPWLGGNTTPALWVAPESLTPFSYANNDPLSLWDDLTCPDNDGILNLSVWYDVQREPKYITSGINGFPSVKFDNTTAFPSQDGLKITNQVSDLTTTSATPNNTAKTVSVVFSYSGSIGTTAQMLFEAGGSTSGYNIYLYNGRIYFGMYRGSERRFVSTTISPGAHIAQLEYDGTRFRGILDGTTTGSLAFTGLVYDNSYAGIGASSTGTRIHTGGYGQTWGLHFNGMIAEIIVNQAFNSGTGGISRVTYDYLDAKYNTTGSYPGGSPRLSEFAANEYNEAGEFFGNSVVSQIYPNPFTETAQFDVVVDESQFVRIELFNAMGQMVSSVFNGNIQGRTIYSFNIDGTQLPSGMYFLKVNGETINQSVPVVLTK